jgi:ABC-2 type transport system permease protein
MSAVSDAAAEPPVTAKTLPPRNTLAAKSFYWSVRRELWEHRSIFIAPLTVAILVLFGFVISMLHLLNHGRFRAESHGFSTVAPYDFAAFSVMATVFVIAVFYSLGALHGERRDRSMLFWKSLPVSDLITVLAKASIPLVVLPAVAFVIIFAMQVIMLILDSSTFMFGGQSAEPLWTQVAPIQNWIALIYSLIVLALWHAPIYTWLLLVSGWAKRAPFLWAVLPPLALCLVEKVAFASSNFAELISYRMVGFTQAYADGAFNSRPPGAGPVAPLQQLDPVRFFTSPGLWLGLVFAAAFLAGAVWLRRRREPI